MEYKDKYSFGYFKTFKDCLCFLEKDVYKVMNENGIEFCGNFEFIIKHSEELIYEVILLYNQM